MLPAGRRDFRFKAAVRHSYSYYRGLEPFLLFLLLRKGIRSCDHVLFRRAGNFRPSELAHVDALDMQKPTRGSLVLETDAAAALQERFHLSSLWIQVTL